MDCFELAADARELDMRASPYDLSDYGFEPIASRRRPGVPNTFGSSRSRASPMRERAAACGSDWSTAMRPAVTANGRPADGELATSYPRVTTAWFDALAREET